MNPTIDLRSDTVTQPTEAMRAAMAAAPVGDDVYGEDPTINCLETRAAEVFEREAAIFVPTGSMGNQIALKLHPRHGLGDGQGRHVVRLSTANGCRRSRRAALGTHRTSAFNRRALL